MKIKIGIGYDIHQLVDGRSLILGATKIDHTKGLLGHSDADVLLHAISDALLGAIGEKNIGELFPDVAEWTQDMPSTKILQHAHGLVIAEGYTISNIDTVIIAEKPKLSPYITVIRSNIADILRLDVADVGIKATTNDGIGEVGQGRAIAAMANVIILKK